MTRANPFKVEDRLRALLERCERMPEVDIPTGSVRETVQEALLALDFVKKSERKRCTIAWARVDIGEGTRFVYCLTHRRDAEVCKEKGLME
jgi:hypothetical protein